MSNITAPGTTAASTPAPRPRARLARRAALAAVCAGTLIAGVAFPALSSAATLRPSSAAHPSFVPLPVVPGSTYLALGDSVTFGYREPDTTPPPDYAKASSFVGYPEDIGLAFGLNVVNAACPGETSGSFITVNAISNGCEHTDTGGPGYRDAYPLHATYSGSQLAFATGFLKANPDTRLVSLMIGANDGFVCEATTKDGCMKELPGLLNKVKRNVGIILSAIRHRVHYTGQIVILDYYSTDYNNVIDSVGSEALNAAVNSVAKPFDVEIANGYNAFRVASVHSGYNTCAAGLLTQLTGKAKGTCGVHPSVAGQALLAQTVEKAFTK
jgi:lysophospholipase L1-like esterase